MSDHTLILDDGLHQRLGRRYGSAIEPWLDGLPARLRELAERWRLDLGSVVPRGTVSVVVNCHGREGTPVILKVSPDHQRIAAEAEALAAWRTRHTPRFIVADASRGALLMEAIRPGTALDESDVVPDGAALAELVRALHEGASPPAAVASVEARIAALYRSGEANYARRPELADVVPHSLYERGRRAADALAAEASRKVMLHGDLTPANVLDAGTGRGLVAIDPAPCWGDPAFDTVDLLLWRAGDLATLTTRAEALAERLRLPADRPLRWCAAFAAMVALERAEAAEPGDDVRMLVELARSA